MPYGINASGVQMQMMADLARVKNITADAEIHSRTGDKSGRFADNKVPKRIALKIALEKRRKNKVPKRIALKMALEKRRKSKQ